MQNRQADTNADRINSFTSLQDNNYNTHFVLYSVYLNELIRSEFCTCHCYINRHYEEDHWIGPTVFLFLRFEMKLSSLFVLLSAFAVQRAWAARSCHMNYGPSGVTECIQLSEYYGYQWATCLTNAYIQQKSNKKHICQYIYATYCWYQCMIEVHDKIPWNSDR